MTCEQIDDRLLDFVEGDLPRDEADAVRVHTRDCASCAAKLHDYRRMFGELSAARSADNRARRPEADAQSLADVHSHRGRTRIGDFEVLDELGRGGMGVVYRARQVSLNRIVALKILAAGAVQSQRAIQRFQHEAQAAARLHHTNIVPIYAQGESEGCYYYAMELIDGKSLSAVLREDPNLGADGGASLRASSPDGVVLSDAQAVTLPTSPSAKARKAEASHQDSLVSRMVSGTLMRPRIASRKYKRVARLFAEVAEALSHAHSQNILHRDIKPQNLLLGQDDKLHITDFGLARLTDEPGLTLTSEIVGTPAYMSPEQIAGGKRGVDPRTDIYSLGVTMYETLTRQRPFQGANYEQTIHQVLEREPAPPRKIDPNIPHDLETICLRAMEKEPARRFQTAAEMAADLRRYATDFPIVSRRVGPLGRLMKWVRRNKPQSLAIAAALVVLMLTPLLLRAIRSGDRGKLRVAYNILLENYRGTDRAEKELQAVSWLSQGLREARLVRALSRIISDPKAARQELEPLVQRQPDDREARYLLAWACVRLARTGDLRLYEEALDHVRLADQAVHVSANGPAEFYRGQALFDTNLDQAVASFRAAITIHPDHFPQAMQHLGRALNQHLYVFRNKQYFAEADKNLNALATLQPKNPYPLYLYSIAFRLRAEILYDEAGSAPLPEDRAAALHLSDEAFSEAAAHARSAIEKDADSPDGYRAAAAVAESRALRQATPEAALRELSKVVATWESMGTKAARSSDSTWRERAVYLMRLRFWLGQYSEAEQHRRNRYERDDDAPSTDDFDPDELIRKAWIARSAGDAATAAAALADAVQRTKSHAEMALALHAAHLLMGFTPPPGLLDDIRDFSTHLSPNWNEAWVRGLVEHAKGRKDWPTLIDELDRDAGTPQIRIQRLAGALFLRAALRFAAGDRVAAFETLRECARTYDNENYCFNARMLYEKHRLNPAWPEW